MAGRQAWVLGGSGAVGRFLLCRLHGAGWQTTAPSRTARPAWAADLTSVSWQDCDLRREGESIPSNVEAIFGAGPLDLLADLLRRQRLPQGARVIALSSTSLMTKRDSLDSCERAVAASLEASESALRAMATTEGWSLVLLRPTLIYGAGIDASLGPLLRVARRLGWLPLPRASRGGRQPVHADDLAAAMLAAFERIDEPLVCLCVPGGEVLPFDEMVQRALALISPAPRLLRVPLPPLRWVSACLRHAPARLARLAAPLKRSGEDLVFPADDWQRLGLTPRGFHPMRSDFDTGQ